MRILLCGFLVFSGMLANHAFSQIIKYVKPIASGTADGSSWANASASLKAIIDAAAPNTQVWVAAGTYKPTANTSRTVSFVMKNGVGIYGGFAGTETLLSQRNWAVNKTILSGDIGVADNVADNSYHVVNNNSNSLDGTAILDGFTITGGNSNGYGGGINNFDAGPSIANCIFIGNQAIDGGGAANQTSKALYINCSFAGNTASATGGGMLNYKSASPPKIINCSFSGNQAASGGAVYNYQTNTELTNCISWGNNSEIVNDGISVPVVSYCLVQGGYAGTGNISTDPKFIVQPAIALGSTGNLRLQTCSPAINVGSNAANSTTLDLAGNARKTGIIDIGAYERPAAAVAGVLFVNDNGPTDGGDGSDWANAFTRLQDALTAGSCAGITQIWVAAGTYKPTADGNRAVSFAMKNNLAIYGGFASTETLLSQRNWNSNVTILSGDIGVGGDNTDNSYHVVMNNNNGLNASAVLDGFTLTGGNANGGSSSTSGGGGVYNLYASPAIANCNFTGNNATTGAAVSNNSSSPSITNCNFSSNQATGNSGAIFNTSASPSIINCSFTGNQAPNGGAINNYKSPASIINCNFSGNSASTGGGISGYNSQFTVTNCSFSGNIAGSGGGIYITGDNFPTNVRNCIVYGNSPGSIVNLGTGTTTVTYSIVQGGYAGTGNLDVDPQFVQQPPIGPGTTGDLRLQICSPAQDAGNDVANASTIDLDGNPRKFNGKIGLNDIDMGAYEIQAICCPSTDTLYVNDNATGSNNGSSWVNAFSSLQDALEQAGLCAGVTQIWVAAGTYNPTTGTDRTIPFIMKNNLAIYGGFAGTETELNQRNWNTNVTILSGDIGSADVNADNSYHVVMNNNNGLNTTAVLDGFTVTGGNADAVSYPNSYGAGMFNNLASPTIAHCSFGGNTAGIGGAMVNNNSSSPAITHCTFSWNTAGTGGAMYNANSSSPAITDCIFTGNNAAGSGNASVGNGGAMINSNVSSPTITNCSFTGNQANNQGGGIYSVQFSSPLIINCSFSGNQGVGGGGIYGFNSSSVVINSIFYGNSPVQILNSGGATTVTHSIIQGGYTGTGNMDIDPQFVEQPPFGLGNSGDLRLQPCSPAINMGNDADNSTTTDLDSNVRKFGSIDMGAYERQSAKPTAWYLDVNATGSGDGTTWANAFTNLATALGQLKGCNSTDSLLIATGTYNTAAPAEFDKLQGVVLGGYPSGGGTRDATANPVIILGTVNVRQSLRMDGVKVNGN